MSKKNKGSDSVSEQRGNLPDEGQTQDGLNDGKNFNDSENGVVADADVRKEKIKKTHKRPWGKKKAQGFDEDGDIGQDDELDEAPESATAGMIEADQIADDGSGGKQKKARKPWSTRKKVILSVVAVVLVAILSAGVYVYTIWSNPMSQFQTALQQITPPPSSSESTVADPENPATPTVNPYDELVKKADMGFLDHIVNIMLIGVDHAVERDTWSGKKAFHSDVMIVLSINTETHDVSMVSLPRDTYAEIPGVDGIYKLNASIDCGGEWPTESGFQKVCEAAEWMLGGDIPIDYYYAVDMNAVKGLVDAIDGVDFDVDIDFKIQGRSYTKGMQHLNGQGVLDYLRVRKNLGKGEEGDLNRINRQKKMLVAIYEKIKEQDLLASIPDLLAAFDGNYFTNTSFAQTAALAAFAYQVPSEKIQMYSMGGHYQNIFNWNFVLTDQKARVELIKKIYGIDAKQNSKYASKAANALWENMQAEDIQKKAKPLLAQIKAVLDADAALPPVPTPTPEAPPETSTAPPETSTVAPTETPTMTPTPTPETTPTMTPASTPTPTPTVTPTATPDGTVLPMMAFATINKGSIVTTVGLEGEYRKFGDDIWALYNNTVANVNRLDSIDSTDALKAANIQVKTDIQSLCGICSIAAPKGGWLKYWRVNYETEDNEIKVNFN